MSRRHPNYVNDHLSLLPRDNGSTLVVSILALLVISFVGIRVPNAHAKPNGPPNDSPATPLGKNLNTNLPITQLSEDEAIIHALNRLAYGPRPDDVVHIRQMGLEKWIAQQLDPDSIDDSELSERLAKYPTLNMSSRKLLEQFPPPNQAARQQGLTLEQYRDQQIANRKQALAQMLDASNGQMDNADRQLSMMQGPNRILAELSMAKVDRAIYSNRQLEAVMEDFWFNHFNVFANKGADKWLVTSYVRDTIRPHTMGKFQDLLIATGKSPAMLFFLDNWQSVDPVAFEQHQREMAIRRQRFSGGFAPFGGSFPGPGGQARGASTSPQQKQERGINENYGREVMELHTVGVDAGYTQQDVIEMAKCLTGWTVREPRRDPEYVFRPEFHTPGEKTVMGHTLNYGGEKDGEEALKMLARDPHTAVFISRELARHFVSDDPPQSLIDRMARTFLKTDGDIRDVLKTMIYSPEFWSRDSYRAKVKTPLEVVASTARALNANVSVSLPLAQWIGRMGEPLFLCQPPTGYSDKAETWINSGALLNRLNFALALASDHMPGSSVNLNTVLGESASGQAETALSRSIDTFLNGQLAAGTRETLEHRMDDPQVLQATLDDPVNHVNEGLVAGLVLGAPEFQHR